MSGVITINDDIIMALACHEWRCGHCGGRPTASVRNNESRTNTFIMFSCHGQRDIHHLQLERAQDWKRLFNITPFEPVIPKKPKSPALESGIISGALSEGLKRIG
jgi:hypothetical protein